jgi:ferric-dicitrate binding protein FerR (iron transport regulator)
MKTESLHALFIDRELGELPAETAELLEAWLAEHPDSVATLQSIRRTLETTGATVRRFPELGRPEPSNVMALTRPRVRLMPLALAASILILLGGSAWLSFRAGEQSAKKALARNNRTLPAPRQNVEHDNGPWAHYAVVSDPRGGLTVVRRDSNSQL